MKNPCRKFAAKANSRPFLFLVNNPKQYLLVCHPYVTGMYSYVIRMSLVCTHAILMPLLCTRMSSVCHWYVFVSHPYVTHMYSYVIRMSLVLGFTTNHLKFFKFCLHSSFLYLPLLIILQHLLM